MIPLRLCAWCGPTGSRSKARGSQDNALLSRPSTAASHASQATVSARLSLNATQLAVLQRRTSSRQGIVSSASTPAGSRCTTPATSARISLNEDLLAAISCPPQSLGSGGTALSDVCTSLSTETLERLVEKMILHWKASPDIVHALGELQRSHECPRLVSEVGAHPLWEVVGGRAAWARSEGPQGSPGARSG